MSLLSRVRDLLDRDRGARTRVESDAPADAQTARTRSTGGVQDSAASDTHSTTGTTPNGTFVGRASGDEAIDAGTTGAEKRAEHEQDGESMSEQFGAARDTSDPPDAAGDDSSR